MNQIDLTPPRYIESFTPEGWSALPSGVSVLIKKDGAVTVTAAESGLLKIRLTYLAEGLEEAYQYGDALERLRLSRSGAVFFQFPIEFKNIFNG